MDKEIILFQLILLNFSYASHVLDIS